MSRTIIYSATARAALLAGLALGWGTQAMAQSAQPGHGLPFYLGRIVVENQTAAEGLREEGFSSSSAIAIIGSEDISQIPAATVAEAFAGVPGVVVQEFFGNNDQPRIQIRGSGLQQSPTERGLLVLSNGMPVNRADGSYIVGLANPGSAEAIEIWRGAAANRLGASVLGGAINFISPTASANPGTEINFGAGNFGRYDLSGQTAFSGDRMSAMLQFDLSQSDGFRDLNHEASRRSIGLNVELPHPGTGATQLFLSYTDLEFDVAGPLTWAALMDNPSAVHPGPTVTLPGPVVTNPGPNVPRDRPRRESSQLLVGARSSFDLGEHRIDLGVSAGFTDDSFMFPISAGERVTDGWDANLFARYAFGPDQVQGMPLFELTLNYALGESDRDYFHNRAGSRGPQFGDFDLESSTLSVSAGANIDLGRSFVLSPSISYTYATRAATDLWTGVTRPTIGYNPVMQMVAMPDVNVPSASYNYDFEFSGWNPRLALSWSPRENQTAWVAVSHGFEPPTHDDILAPFGGSPFAGPGRPNPMGVPPIFVVSDLEAQTATTLEFGWRGALDSGFAWDVAAYHSWIENEILSLRDVSAARRASLNAGDTEHTGLELGLSGPITDRLSGRLAYTYQDFRFVDDPLRGNNRLGGAPRHVINASLAWEATPDLTLFGTLRWIPEETPVDNMNTLFAEPYSVVDLRAEYRINDTASLVAEVTNLFDERYASSTLVVDQARPDQAAFIPGVGRAFYIGTSLRF